MGKPLPKPGGLCHPLRAQVLQPWLGDSPVMACLIEVAYEGAMGSQRPWLQPMSS